MLLVNAAAKSGEWFTFIEVTDADGTRQPEKDAKFLIRRVPAAVRQKLMKRRAEREPTKEFKGDGVVVPNNPEVTRENDVAYAAYALLDSKNAEIPGDAIGEKEEIVLLDGRWDNEDLKHRVLIELWSGDSDCLTKWITTQAYKLEVVAKQAEAELGKT